MALQLALLAIRLLVLAVGGILCRCISIVLTLSGM
jgi:hypothetical protein